MDQFTRTILSLIIGLVVDKKQFGYLQKAFHEMDQDRTGELTQKNFENFY